MLVRFTGTAIVPIPLRILALSTAWIVMSTTPLISAADLSRYHGFEFGSSLAKVARQAGISPEPRVVHQRPELIQELMWLPGSPTTSEADVNSVRKVIFTFYNDQLSRIVVSYHRDKTEGLTAEDLVEAVSAMYGETTIPAPRSTSQVIPPSSAQDKFVAHWEDPQYSVTLFRSSYLSTFGLVLLSKRLDGLASLASAEAILQDDREAPQREVERQQNLTAENRVKEETARRANKATFKP
jgi:hypothetical protein